MVRPLLKFLARAHAHRALILAMAWREIRTRYAGTLAGLVWSVLHPLMMILIYWFVFSVGFKVQTPGGLPFIIVFLCGWLPWSTFSETVMASTSAISGNPHLVKKTLFPTEILPLVHLMASLISHLIMLAILAVLLVVYRQGFSVLNLQFPYYLLGMSVLCVGLGWLVSALNVFYRDVGQILSVLLNMWFWLTPIVWQMDMLPERYRPLLSLNPMYYVVEGYRMSFIVHAGLWRNWQLGLYFWAVSLAALALGGLVFRRLKPEFAEAM